VPERVVLIFRLTLVFFPGLTMIDTVSKWYYQFNAQIENQSALP
jgi:hypothetical protein